MKNLEPTYLRYVYDALNKGSLNAENSAALPQGFIGLYEQEFTQKTPAGERKKVLNQLALWALFKGPVSANLAASVLELEEEQMKDLVDTYSSWFNSPESGVYQLYHDRLRVYLFQKLNEQELEHLNEQLISYLEKAIKDQKADEAEYYALEFLTIHYSVNAMLTGEVNKLKKIVYCHNYWQRQISLSSGYNWTKNSLRTMMRWSSKYNDNEVIECSIHMLDLHYEKQNAAIKIVDMVNEHNFEFILDILSRYGGNSEIGRIRKCQLFLIVFTKILLISQAHVQSRKRDLEKLVFRFKEIFDFKNFEVNYFYPSFLLFKIVSGLNEFQIDYSFLFSQIKWYDSYWLGAIKLSKKENELLNELEKVGMTDNLSRVREYKSLKDLHNIHRNLSYSVQLSQAFNSIHDLQFEADIWALKGKYEEALNCILKSLIYRKISDNYGLKKDKKETPLLHNTISYSLSKTEFLDKNNYENYLKLSDYINSNGKELILGLIDRKMYSQANDILFKIKKIEKDNKWLVLGLMDRKMYKQVNNLLYKIKKYDGDFYFKNTIQYLCLHLVGNSWKDSEKFLKWIGIPLFNERDAILYLKNHQSIFPFNEKLITVKWYEKLFSSYSGKIKNVHLDCVILINSYLKHRYNSQTVALRLANNIKKLNGDKIVLLLDFFIVYLPKEITVIIDEICLRIENEGTLKMLYEIIVLLDKYKYFDYSKLFRDKFVQKLKLCDDLEMLENRILYFNILNYSIGQLIMDFHNQEKMLMSSLDGYRRWNECLFNLINKSVELGGDHWKALIKFQLDNRSGNEEESLSFLGQLNKTARCLCSKKNYSSALNLANMLTKDESEWVLKTIVLTFLEDGEYDRALNFIEEQANYKHYSVFADTVIDFLFNEKNINAILIKKFSKIISFGNSRPYVNYIPFKSTADYLKVIDFDNIDLAESILAKYAINRILMGDYNDDIFKHINVTLNLCWHDKNNQTIA